MPSTLAFFFQFLFYIALYIVTGREIEKETVDAEIFDIPRKFAESRLNPLPLLDISNTNSGQSTPQLSPTKIEEGWLVAPPPCFTLNCPTSLEVSPLEDLLIEHPSMSVYGQIPNLKQNEPDLDVNLTMIEADTETGKKENLSAHDLASRSGSKFNSFKSYHDITSTYIISIYFLIK